MKKHGCLWWVCIGWWWVPITLPFRIPAALVRRTKARPSEGKPMPTSTKPVNSIQKEETHKVAGTSLRQEALMSLGTKNPDFAKTKKVLQQEGLTEKWVYEYEFAPRKVELQPEPDNPHDPKAIKVLVDGTHIGYIKAGSCAHVHKLLESDRILRISCSVGGGKSKRLSWDDDNENYTLEQDEFPFYARLTITTKPET